MVNKEAVVDIVDKVKKKIELEIKRNNIENILKSWYNYI